MILKHYDMKHFRFNEKLRENKTILNFATGLKKNTKIIRNFK